MGWQLPFHPDDMEIAIAKWQHSLSTGDPYTTEYRCRRHDGEWRWMLGRALPFRDPETNAIAQWFGTCTDIHDLVEARLSARRTREHLLSVVAYGQVTLWAIDNKRKITLIEGRFLWDLYERDRSREPSHECFVGKDVSIHYALLTSFNVIIYLWHADLWGYPANLRVSSLSREPRLFASNRTHP
jgi:hypothetical protein